MKLWFKVLLLTAPLIIFGCVTGKDVSRDSTSKTGKEPLHLRQSLKPQKTAVSSTPTYDSIHFYTLGEFTYQLGDFQTAYGLFNQADLHDQANITIKERILETLFILAREDKNRYSTIIRLGEDYFSRGLYSASLIRYLGLAYLQMGKNEEGLKMMEFALEMDPSPYNYYDYFLYLLRHGNRIEFLYLEKALKDAYNKPELLYSIAEIYEYHNPLRTKEILETAFQKIGDQEAKEQLLSFYKKYNDWDSLIVFLRERLEAGDLISTENRIFLLELLYAREDFRTILNLYNSYNDLDDPEIQEYFFLAAYHENSYEKGIVIGKEIIRNQNISSDKRNIFLALLSELYALLQDYLTAADFLMQIGEPGLAASVIRSSSNENGERFDPEKLIQAMKERRADHALTEYLVASYYLSRDKEDEGLTILRDLIRTESGSIPDFEEQFFEERLLKSIANLFLDYGDPEKAKESLLLIPDPEFCPYSFIGSYYRYFEQDSLAIDFYTKAVESKELPGESLMLTLASLLNTNKEYGKELQLMERAQKLYPEDPLILNWLGYSLIVHSTRYEEAEEYLLKAISLMPDSHFIQDSVAWLYYKKQDYEKALSYMQQIIENGVEDSVVLYHLGMIYYKLEEKKNAVFYFQEAVLMNTDEEYRIKAEKMLEEITKIYE